MIKWEDDTYNLGGHTGRTWHGTHPDGKTRCWKDPHLSPRDSNSIKYPLRGFFECDKLKEAKGQEYCSGRGCVTSYPKLGGSRPLFCSAICSLGRVWRGQLLGVSSLAGRLPACANGLGQLALTSGTGAGWTQPAEGTIGVLPTVRVTGSGPQGVCPR